MKVAVLIVVPSGGGHLPPWAAITVGLLLLTAVVMLVGICVTIWRMR